MKQVDFEKRLSAEWLAIDQWMDGKIGKSRGISTLVRVFPIQLEQHAAPLLDRDFPAAFRRVCQHLAIAKARMYSHTLIEFLQDLVHRGHSILYRPKSIRISRFLRFVAIDFPVLVRKHWIYMTASAALFFLPLLAMIVLIPHYPQIAQAVFDGAQLSEFESMYDPKNEALGRESGSDLQMFGYYIYNNISIGFRTFASGLFAGIGSMLVLLFNGVVIGGVAGHLTHIGYGEPFWRFVVGHSGPELMAIVIAGGAGMQLGFSLLIPGRKTRRRALADAGRDGAVLCFGVFLLLMVAAFIEAFWSSKSMLPMEVKLVFGLGLWSLILAWLSFSGRGRERYVE